MKYIVTSNKPITQAIIDLEKAITNNGFGILHVHNVKATMAKKNVDFPHECYVYEVCNPHIAKDILSIDMDLIMALPCRISIYSVGNQTKISMIKPMDLLTNLSSSADVTKHASKAEEISIKIIQQAK
ncbi:MAG: hypothetical protein DRQ51_03950 [Gammaproteobacteria bacterium]|nr:MAG: hypothetical protein DRQ51_03950 [Gammaproteobacteria bacterium]